ncbi:MAG: sugar phosphate isomerase/epimerase family protein [Candidatus Bathyarchaeia archaeon]
MGIKFSVTTYGTQNVILPEDLVPKLAEWGYDGIELWGGRVHKQGQPKWGLEGRTDNEIGRLRNLVDQYGLEVPAVSTYFSFTSGKQNYEKSLRTGRRYSEIARLFGAKVVRVVGEGMASAEMTEEKWKVFIMGLKDLASIGDEYDVTFGLELHGNTPHDTILGQLRCIWQADSHRIRVLYQPTTTSQLEPEVDQMWALDKLFPYIVHVHMQASVSFGYDTLLSREHDHVHWSQMLEEMRRKGYSGYISVERVPEPTLKNLEKEIEWLKRFSS